jgi:hypothetical protein
MLNLILSQYQIDSRKKIIIFRAVVGVLCVGFFSLASPTTALSHPMCKKLKLIYSVFIKLADE